MPLTRLRFPVAALLTFFAWWSLVAQDGPKKTNDVHATIAIERGWVTNHARGREIIRELSAVSPERREKPWTDSYRGEKVVFVGSTAPPGTDDLLTEGGFYLRVLYPKGKRPAPRAYIWHETMVHGTILRVYPANSLIVIEVDDEWLIQSG